MEKSVDFEIEVNLLKVDPNYADQRIAYGWAWVSEEGGNLYFDDEGDAISEADLEKAFHEFVLESRAGADYHGKDGKGDPRQVSRLVECVVLTKAKQAAMGVTLPNGRVGAWVGFYFDDDETWSLVKSGEYRSFSIGGAATRVPVEKYDPDQPRDDFGRWTDTGGGFGRTEERLPGGHFQGSDTRIPPVRLKPLYAGGYEVVEDSDTFGGRNFGTIEERGGLWAATDGIGEAVGEWGSKQTAAMMAAQSTLRRGKG